MAIGKNKNMAKGGRKGGKGKRTVDAMLRKEWYDVVAPDNFKLRQFCKTLGNKTVGNKVGSDNLMGRVYEANLADLQQITTADEIKRDEPYRKIRFCVQDVDGRNLLTQFYGMDLTTDRIRSLFRKWCTTIESTISARTADGYEMRLFVICFTKRQKTQTSKNCYANSRLVRWLRHRMTRVIRSRLSKLTINKAVSDLTNDAIADVVARSCNTILPIRDLKIRKVKVTKAPKFDKAVHGEIPESKENQPRDVETAAEPVAAAAE